MLPLNPDSSFLGKRKWGVLSDDDFDEIVEPTTLSDDNLDEIVESSITLPVQSFSEKYVESTTLPVQSLSEKYTETECKLFSRFLREHKDSGITYEILNKSMMDNYNEFVNLLKASGYIDLDYNDSYRGTRTVYAIVFCPQLLNANIKEELGHYVQIDANLKTKEEMFDLIFNTNPNPTRNEQVLKYLTKMLIEKGLPDDITEEEERLLLNLVNMRKEYIFPVEPFLCLMNKMFFFDDIHRKYYKKFFRSSDLLGVLGLIYVPFASVSGSQLRDVFINQCFNSIQPEIRNKLYELSGHNETSAQRIETLKLLVQIVTKSEESPVAPKTIINEEQKLFVEIIRKGPSELFENYHFSSDKVDEVAKRFNLTPNQSKLAAFVTLLVDYPSKIKNQPEALMYAGVFFDMREKDNLSKLIFETPVSPERNLKLLKYLKRHFLNAGLPEDISQDEIKKLTTFCRDFPIDFESESELVKQRKKFIAQLTGIENPNYSFIPIYFPFSQLKDGAIFIEWFKQHCFDKSSYAQKIKDKITTLCNENKRLELLDVLISFFSEISLCRQIVLNGSSFVSASHFTDNIYATLSKKNNLTVNQSNLHLALNVLVYHPGQVINKPLALEFAGADMDVRKKESLYKLIFETPVGFERNLTLLKHLKNHLLNAGFPEDISQDEIEKVTRICHAFNKKCGRIWFESSLSSLMAMAKQKEEFFAKLTGIKNPGFMFLLLYFPFTFNSDNSIYLEYFKKFLNFCSQETLDKITTLCNENKRLELVDLLCRIFEQEDMQMEVAPLSFEQFWSSLKPKERSDLTITYYSIMKYIQDVIDHDECLKQVNGNQGQWAVEFSLKQIAQLIKTICLYKVELNTSEDVTKNAFVLKNVLSQFGIWRHLEQSHYNPEDSAKVIRQFNKELTSQLGNPLAFSLFCEVLSDLVMKGVPPACTVTTSNRLSPAAMDAFVTVKRKELLNSAKDPSGKGKYTGPVLGFMFQTNDAACNVEPLYAHFDNNGKLEKVLPMSNKESLKVMEEVLGFDPFSLQIDDIGDKFTYYDLNPELAKKFTDMIIETKMHLGDKPFIILPADGVRTLVTQGMSDIERKIHEREKRKEREEFERIVPEIDPSLIRPNKIAKKTKVKNTTTPKPVEPIQIDLPDEFWCQIAKAPIVNIKRKQERDAVRLAIWKQGDYSRVNFPFSDQIENIINGRITVDDFPEHLFEQLKGYQRETVEDVLKLWKSGIKGSVLALDPGLGKSIIMIALMWYHLNQNPHAQILFVAPKSTLDQFKCSFQYFTTILQLDIIEKKLSQNYNATLVHIVQEYDASITNHKDQLLPEQFNLLKSRISKILQEHGKKSESGSSNVDAILRFDPWSQTYENNHGILKGDEARVFITLDTTVKKIHEQFPEDHLWDLVCIDEVHRYQGEKKLKNIQDLVSSRGRTCVLATGTPIQNEFEDMDELVSIFVPPEEMVQFNLSKSMREKMRSDSLSALEGLEKKQELEESDIYNAFMIVMKDFVNHQAYTTKLEPLFRRHTKTSYKVIKDLNGKIPTANEKRITVTLEEAHAKIIQAKEDAFAKKTKGKALDFFSHYPKIQRLLIHPSMAEMEHLTKDEKDAFVDSLVQKIEHMSDEDYQSWLKQSAYLVQLVNEVKEYKKKENQEKVRYPMVDIVELNAVGNILQAVYQRELGPNSCVQFLNGDILKNADRWNIIKKFKESPAGRFTILILSRKAGGVGLDLPEGKVLRLIQGQWNLGERDQAKSRIIRANTDSKEREIREYDCRTNAEERLFYRQMRKTHMQSYVFLKRSLTRENVVPCFRHYLQVLGGLSNFDIGKKRNQAKWDELTQELVKYARQNTDKMLEKYHTCLGFDPMEVEAPKEDMPTLPIELSDHHLYNFHGTRAPQISRR